MPPEDRLAVRQEHSAQITAALRRWFEKQLSMRNTKSPNRRISASPQAIALVVTENRMPCGSLQETELVDALA
ncbi:hypothetical protein SAMN04488498_13125 [Mesorhizobium albiziae]|uniref:Uncharacterized protein n=1 Tax=Neomesorhizobium albiziae TaxID=335020 RepID=A0A1I4EVU5_9HYPH|nr:hypothetical protein SAMN04488498_13125 [Mesorhizobium albiziae]